MVDEIDRSGDPFARRFLGGGQGAAQEVAVAPVEKIDMAQMDSDRDDPATTHMPPAAVTDSLSRRAAVTPSRTFDH